MKLVMSVFVFMILLSNLVKVECVYAFFVVSLSESLQKRSKKLGNF